MCLSSLSSLLSLSSRTQIAHVSIAGRQAVPHQRSLALHSITVLPTNMDIASRALVKPLPEGIPDTLPARAAHFKVPLATFYARKNKRPSREDKARD